MSALQIMRDEMKLKTNSQIDRQADERGLHTTLDGVHLNSTGADIVANEFMDTITAVQTVSD